MIRYILIQKILREGLNLQKKDKIKTAIDFVDNHAYYATNKFGDFFNIDGVMVSYNTGRSIEYSFEPNMIPEEFEKNWDDNWEEI